jgi:hypothetical protein
MHTCLCWLQRITDQLKDLHAHQGNLGLKERVQTGVDIELLAAPGSGIAACNDESHTTSGQLLDDKGG